MAAQRWPSVQVQPPVWQFSAAACLEAHAGCSAAVPAMTCAAHPAAHTCPCPTPALLVWKQEWKPSTYKALRLKIAQLLTVKREREVRLPAACLPPALACHLPAACCCLPVCVLSRLDRLLAFH